MVSCILLGERATTPGQFPPPYNNNDLHALNLLPELATYLYRWRRVLKLKLLYLLPALVNNI